MNILFVHQNFPAQYRHLAPALAAQGHQVVALTIHRPAIELPGVRVIGHRPHTISGNVEKDLARPYVDLLNKFARGESAHRSLVALKKRGFIPDVACVHPGWGDALFVKDVFPDSPIISFCEFYYGARGLDTDFDPEFQSHQPAEGGRILIKNTHLLHGLSLADVGVAPTRFQRDAHPKWSWPKIEIIHDGIDTQLNAPDPAATVSLRREGKVLKVGDEVITFVARNLEPYRGYHSFMRALPKILEARPNAEVVIVGGNKVSYGFPHRSGSSWKDIFFREVAKRIDRKRVHFVGTVPHHVLRQLFQVSAAHVYLTYPFVLSWSMLEAMSAGALVIGSRTAPVEEVIEHGKNGLLVDFFDIDEIENTVIEALAHPKRMTPLRLAARKTVCERYDLHTICLPEQLKIVSRIVRDSHNKGERGHDLAM